MVNPVKASDLVPCEQLRQGRGSPRKQSWRWCLKLPLALAGCMMINLMVVGINHSEFGCSWWPVRAGSRAANPPQHPMPGGCSKPPWVHCAAETARCFWAGNLHGTSADGGSDASKISTFFSVFTRKIQLKLVRSCSHRHHLAPLKPKVSWIWDASLASFFCSSDHVHAEVLIRVEHQLPVRFWSATLQLVFLRFDEDLHANLEQALYLWLNLLSVLFVAKFVIFVFTYISWIWIYMFVK